MSTGSGNSASTVVALKVLPFKRMSRNLLTSYSQERGRLLRGIHVVQSVFVVYSLSLWLFVCTELNGLHHLDVYVICRAMLVAKLSRELLGSHVKERFQSRRQRPILPVILRGSFYVVRLCSLSLTSLPCM
jgi:hypothetical protein